MAYAPFGAPGSESWGTFVEAAPISHYIFDRPICGFPLLAGAHVNNSLVSMGTGTPAVAEIATSELGGLTLDADNESFGFMLKIPLDIDLAKDMDFRVLWSNSAAAGSGSARFYFLYMEMIVGTTAIAIPATAMDTNGANQVDLGAEIFTNSPWSIISGGTLSATPGDDWLNFKVKVDLTTITDATVYGIDYRYYRKYLA